MCYLPKRQSNITTKQIYRYEPLVCMQPPTHCCNYGNSLTNKQMIVARIILHAINWNKSLSKQNTDVFCILNNCLFSNVIILATQSSVSFGKFQNLLFVYLESVAVVKIEINRPFKFTCMYTHTCTYLEKCTKTAKREKS